LVTSIGLIFKFLATTFFSIQVLNLNNEFVKHKVCLGNFLKTQTSNCFQKGCRACCARFIVYSF